MKKHFFRVVGILIGVLGILGLGIIIYQKYPEYQYDKVVSQLTIVTPDDINKKIETGEKFVLFTGRKTCPDCRKFVSKLKKIQVDIGEDMPILYLNSEDRLDTSIQLFRDLYEIEEVPSLIIFANGESTVLNPESTVLDIEEKIYDLQ